MTRSARELPPSPIASGPPPLLQQGLATKRSRASSILRSCLWAGSLALLLIPLAGKAEPVLFRITGGTATHYLFGSMHLLPAHTEWRTQAFDDAVASTRAECFELANAPDLTMLFQLGPGLDFAYPLHKDLTRDQFARVKADARAAGLPLDLVDHMRPWLAALTFVSLAETRETRLKSPGVDTQMMAAARNRNIPVCGLETMASFVALLNDLPRPDQVAMLREVLAPAPADTASNADIFDAWASGDLARLDALGEASSRQAPALFDALLRRRNQAWLPEIDAILKSDTPTIITVGALHLLGPNGLVHLLEQRGYQLERIQ